MTIRISRSESIVHIEIDRPPVNALNGRLYTELTAAFRAVSPDEVVLLISRSRHFSSGQDLNEHSGARSVAQHAFDLRTGAAAVVAALQCRAPVVAAVHGAAIGAGALLACAADVLVVAEDAWFSLPELQIGVSVGEAVANRAFGGPLTRRMLLTGDRVDALQLSRMGAARMVERSELELVAHEYAAKIAGLDIELVNQARSSWGRGEREHCATAYLREVEDFITERLSGS